MQHEELVLDRNSECIGLEFMTQVAWSGLKSEKKIVSIPRFLQVIKEPVPADEDDDAEKKEEDAPEEEKPEGEDEDAAVEEVEEEKPEPKTVDKTVWDWLLINDNKPLWTRK